MVIDMASSEMMLMVELTCLEVTDVVVLPEVVVRRVFDYSISC
jgi:hypothetical protein